MTGLYKQLVQSAVASSIHPIISAPVHIAADIRKKELGLLQGGRGKQLLSQGVFLYLASTWHLRYSPLSGKYTNDSPWSLWRTQKGAQEVPGLKSEPRKQVQHSELNGKSAQVRGEGFRAGFGNVTLHLQLFQHGHDTARHNMTSSYSAISPLPPSLLLLSKPSFYLPKEAYSWSRQSQR